MGVTTVMAMVAIVTGFNNNVIGNLQTFGANRIEIQQVRGPLRPRRPAERRGEAPEEPDRRGRGGAARARSRTRRWGSCTPSPRPSSTSRTATSRPTARTSWGATSSIPPRPHRASAADAASRPRRCSTTRSSWCWGREVQEALFPKEDPDREGHHGRGPALPRHRRAGEEGGAVRLLARQQGGRALRGLRAAVRLPGADGRREPRHRAPAHGGHAGGDREGGGRPAGAPPRALRQAQRLRGRHARTSSSRSSGPSPAASPGPWSSWPSSRSSSAASGS